MVGTKIAVLLQAAVFLSGVTARCLRNCPADDPLLVLLRSDDTATAFCSDFLGLPVSTVDATVTPTVIATVAETDYVTEVVTEIESTTVTVSAAAPTTTAAPTFTAKKRAVPLPSWLPTSYGPKYISKACSCLSISPSVSTLTETAEPVTITQPVTTTATTTTTVLSTAITTETAAPPAPVTRRVYIEILRKDTGASVGYLYNSNGPALGTVSQAIPVTFTVPSGVTTASQLRITGDGLTPSALGFFKDSNPQNIVELENAYGSVAWLEPTPPGSKPAANDNSSIKWETDIWIVNTDTREISWQWIATSGALPTISIWRAGGRLYPVGDTARFLAATGGVSASKYEVVFKYVQIAT